MKTKITRDNYGADLEEQFLASSIADLNRGNIIYVYKNSILEKLKQLFNNLEITKKEFYWRVKNIEVEKHKPKRGRPKKMVGDISER